MSKDNINPDHYKKGDVECIIALEAATVGKTGIEAVCTANVIKYLWRYEDKNGLEDVRKGMWYLQRLISVLEAKETKKYPLTPEESFKETKEDKLIAKCFHDLDSDTKVFVGDKYKDNEDDNIYTVKSFDFNSKQIYLEVDGKEITGDIEDFLENYKKIEEVKEEEIHRGDLFRSNNLLDKDVYELIGFNEPKQVVILRTKEDKVIHTIPSEDFLNNFTKIELFDKVSIRNPKEEKKVSEIPSKSLEGQKFIFNQAQEIFKKLIGKKFTNLINNKLFIIEECNKEGTLILKSNTGSIVFRTFFELMDETAWKQVDS